jgi:hypothetical protein
MAISRAAKVIAAVKVPTSTKPPAVISNFFLLILFTWQPPGF